MHEGIWSEGGFAGITGVDKPTRTFPNGHGVTCAELHEQIVWMLAIDQGFAFISFAGLEKQRRTARRESEGLGAEHAAQLECARTRAPDCRGHEPVCGFNFGYASWSALAI